MAGTSASAVLVYSTVTALHPKGAAAYASLAAGLIVLAGVLFLCSGLFRLGFITQFLSRPVMDGFVFGLAIFVAVSQLPKLFGLAKGPGDTIRQFAQLITHLGEASRATFAVGAAALALLFTLDRREFLARPDHPAQRHHDRRLPGLVIGVVLSVLVFVYRASRPVFSVLGRHPDVPGAYEDIGRHKRARPLDGVLVDRPDAPLFFANAQPLRDTVSHLARPPPRRCTSSSSTWTAPTSSTSPARRRWAS